MKLLTKREKQILAFTAQGDPAKIVGKAFGIKEKTVKMHLANVRMKLDAYNTVQAVAIAVSRGIIVYKE